MRGLGHDGAGLLRWLVGLLSAVCALPTCSAQTTLLAQRMQLFHEGALRGFALAELPDDGREIYTESDFEDLAATGANVVRVPIRLKKCTGCKSYELPESGIRYAERVLRRGERHGFRVVVVLLPLMFEPVPWALPGSFWQAELLVLPGVVYSFHLYAPHEFTHQGLPGYDETRTYPGAGWDKARLAQEVLEARNFATANKVPMFVGEFSCVRWAPSGSCLRYLADAVSLFEGQGWGWAYHCWRCYQGWDAEVPASLPQAQRSGLLPTHRTADNATAVLLRAALSRNTRGLPVEVPGLR